MRNNFHLMTMAILAVAFAACQKEPAFLADLKLPKTATGSNMVVDAWANNFPLEINTEGSWSIESSDFIYIVPSRGNGTTTVTVYVENNHKEQRLKGQITVVFPGHEEQNKTLAVEQKWLGEYDENADEMGTTNNIYGFGFGYDTTKGLYANTSCLKAEIFQTGRLITENKAGRSSLQMHTVVNTVTGNSITDLSNKLTVKMGANGGVGKFKAEAKASFTMNYKDNSNHEYAINYLEVALYTTSCTLPMQTLRTSTEENKYGYMTAEAYKAINGLDPNFPTTPDGVKELVSAYGTHVVMSSRLGGRVRQSLDIDITNIEESYDLNVFAKASYEGVLVKETSGSVDDDFHDTYKKHKDEFKTELDVLGGDLGLATAMSPKGGFNESNYTAWMKSLEKSDNLALVGFAEGGLVPLYECVDKAHYPDRYKYLYDYIHDGKAALDFPDNSTYDSGTVTAFDVPDFSDNQGWGNTLVKEIRLGGQLVGQVCEEYIPAINDKERVIVVYPVIGTTVRYNMGFFIGDDTHQPARVAWNGTNTNIEAYDLDFGQVSKLYLRGASITTTPAEGAVVKYGTLEDKFLTGLYYDIGDNDAVWGNADNIVNKRFDYPLVKIFNKLWTRIDYCQAIAGNDFFANSLNMDAFKDYEGNQITDIKEDDWLRRARVYYSLAQAKRDNVFPAGWRVASSTDYEEMWGKLKANGWSLPGVALMYGQVTGYDIVWAGYRTTKWQNTRSQMQYITSDGCRAILQDTGQFEVSHDAIQERWNMCLRLVKE